MDLPDIPEQAIPLAVAVWVLLGMLKPLLRRVIPADLLGDLLPVMSVLMCYGLALGALTDDPINAGVYAVVMAVTAAGAHDLYEHYNRRNEVRTNA